MVEDAKTNDPSTCLQAFQQLFQLSDSSSQLNGLTLLRHVISTSWARLGTQQQSNIVQLLHTQAQAVDFGAMAGPVCTQFAYALTDASVAAGKDAVEHTVSNLVVQLIQKGVLPGLPVHCTPVDIYRFNTRTWRDRASANAHTA